MNRALATFLVLGLFISLALAAPAAAATQPFFQGHWRCQGQSLDVNPSFGPWYIWRSNGGGNTAQSFLYHDTSGGGWVYHGVDSNGGYWSMTSRGWQNNQLAFAGTYWNNGAAQSMRQVITRNAGNAFTLQSWRNGNQVAQMGCNR